eukprot:CAMPEP_0175466896 /NCGR_PEP_ID=MMETSP0095-20121207/71043_1 /TAXON_ID=311494 /ORGANISM="Alexandrium monilatum, Strain CCMP3105" /LENGTH=72 /DNA_ID=CAMNT_0016768257 /DNA_START=8 /DNA_END=223 /DNA_ORIENTATION=-
MAQAVGAATTVASSTTRIPARTPPAAALPGAPGSATGAGAGREGCTLPPCIATCPAMRATRLQGGRGAIALA